MRNDNSTKFQLAQNSCYWRFVFVEITIKHQTFHASVGKIQLSSCSFFRLYFFGLYFSNILFSIYKFAQKFSSFCCQIPTFTLLFFSFQLFKFLLINSNFHASTFQFSTFQVSALILLRKQTFIFKLFLSA